MYTLQQHLLIMLEVQHNNSHTAAAGCTVIMQATEVDLSQKGPAGSHVWLFDTPNQLQQPNSNLQKLNIAPLLLH